MRKLVILLVTLALIAGVAGCPADPEPVPPVEYSLTLSSSVGGSVTTPGEGTFSYDAGTEVGLVAKPDVGYRFLNWTGDVSNIVDPEAVETVIMMSDHCSITANFEDFPPRMGAWVDEVVITQEPDPTHALLKLVRGDYDLYASPIDDPQVFGQIVEHPELQYVFGHFGSRELTFNPVGPVFPGSGGLNPFAVAKIREAMNWLIDRDHIVAEYLHGMGHPKWTLLGTQFPEHTIRYPHIVKAIEAYYDHDFDRARDVFDEEMGKLGAFRDRGVWTYNGGPVEIRILIRTDLSPYPAAGNYVAELLEDIGFVVDRRYCSSLAEAYRIFGQSDPGEGLFHICTAAWGSPGSRTFPRWEGGSFDQMYTTRSYALPLWQALAPDPRLDEAARRLRFHDFTTMREREELVETALWVAMEDSCRIWLADTAAAYAVRHDVAVAVDATAGIADYIWAHTVHFRGDDHPVPGGTLRVATAQVLAGPWNPLGGSTAAVDILTTGRAVGDTGVSRDNRDGLYWPQRIDRAEVYVQEGLPMDITHDWLIVEFVSEIVVPPDAWADWDAARQRFITVAERFPEGTTALRKSVVYYPAGLYDVPLHDGSAVSIGDFIMAMIVRFDRAKQESPVFDEAEVADFEAWLGTFKGVRITSEDPLVIETYSDAPVFYSVITKTYEDYWHLDAESNVTAWFPTYGAYDAHIPSQPRNWTGFWHMITTGWLAESNTELAFSSGKARALGVEWMDYTKGPSIPILKKWLDWATAENYIPYAPTLEKYISVDEAAERWANLQGWYADKGHLWVGNGPFYLEAVYPEERIVHLKRFVDYPDRADKWLFLLEPLP